MSSKKKLQEVSRMDNFLEIKCLDKEKQKEILKDIEQRIQQKIKDGVFTRREIREIEQMKLRPLPDIQDVQSTYEPIGFDD
jgi:hypothetical protein